jgi:hypothetical protein
MGHGPHDLATQTRLHMEGTNMIELGLLALTLTFLFLLRTWDRGYGK